MKPRTLALVVLLVLEPARAQATPERGDGIPTSLFGTYIAGGDFLVYPFYEYTKTSAFEYKASEFGLPGEADFLGKTVEQEWLVFLGYGLTDGLAVELEMALHASTSFDKAPDDPTAVPTHIEESGFGDVDVQLRWRWAKETERRPEMYGFFELTPPLQRTKQLIGTQEWEASLGFGVVRGYRWGTIGGRASIAWDGEDEKLDLGEYAFEYLKPVSPTWRLVGTLEGETDELSLIGEAQWQFCRLCTLKLNCGFGITQKAPDVAPEVGVLFRF